jgi:hypothetical protein
LGLWNDHDGIDDVVEPAALTVAERNCSIGRGDGLEDLFGRGVSVRDLLGE